MDNARVKVGEIVELRTGKGDILTGIVEEVNADEARVMTPAVQEFFCSVASLSSLSPVLGARRIWRMLG